MGRSSWAPAATPRPRCCCCCAPATANGPWPNTKRAMRKMWPRCFRRTASTSTSRATATASRPSTACTWKNWWRKRKSEGKRDRRTQRVPRPVLPAGLFLRRGEVADDHVLLHLVDDDLVGLLCLAGVELDRFVDVLVLLFGQLVVGIDFDGVLVLLGVGALQLQRDIADALGDLGLAQFNLDVVALAEAAERLQLLRVGGDEAALHTEIAARALEVGDGLLQFGLGGGDLGLDAAHVGGDVGDFGVSRVGGSFHLADRSEERRV